MFAPSAQCGCRRLRPPRVLHARPQLGDIDHGAGGRASLGCVRPFVHPVTVIGPDSLELLGRGLAHWSFFFKRDGPERAVGGDPRCSSSEGNAIVDFGGNVFGDCLNPSETRFGGPSGQRPQYLSRHLAGLMDTARDVGICGKRVSRAVSFCPASGRARKLDSIVWNSWWSSLLAPGSVHDSREVGSGPPPGGPSSRPVAILIGRRRWRGMAPFRSRTRRELSPT